MRFTIDRETLLKPLQVIAGVVERRKSLPILANILIQVNAKRLCLVATDTEIELDANLTLIGDCEEGAITVPGRKLFDICRALPEVAQIEFQADDQRLNIRSEKSKFTLLTLPAEDFPRVEEEVGLVEFKLMQHQLHSLIQYTYFAMAQQDVRYFLNGLLFEIRDQELIIAATDGHRMSISQYTLPKQPQLTNYRIIIPRKGVLELMRFLQDNDDTLDICISNNHIKIQVDNYSFISKLIDGRFPDYNAAIPAHCNKPLTVDREKFKEALMRTAILSNEKFRGVCLQLRQGFINVIAHNPEQEEAEEQLEALYEGDDLDIAFNVNYLLDILNTLPSEQVTFLFADANSSLLVKEIESARQCYFVVMPMTI
ncbi:MAG: DNA polymerase III subunit beta [Legionellales bacterium]|nr:DNA polymerase III subunit beta [Legionellales bacterium]